MNGKCNDCTHNKVCKYIDEFDRHVKGIGEMSDIVNVECKHKEVLKVYTYPSTYPPYYPQDPLTTWYSQEHPNIIVTCETEVGLEKINRYFTNDDNSLIKED